MGEGGRRIASGFSHPHPWLCCAPAQASRAIQREAPEPARKADLSHKCRSTPHLPCRTWQRQWPGCRVPPPLDGDKQKGVEGRKAQHSQVLQEPVSVVTVLIPCPWFTQLLICHPADIWCACPVSPAPCTGPAHCTLNTCCWHGWPK